MRSLPSAVPGSVLVSHRPILPRGDYEVVYTVPGQGKIPPLRKTTMVATAYNQVFTLVFCVETEDAASSDDLSKHMLESFQTFEPENLRRMSSASDGAASNPESPRLDKPRSSSRGHTSVLATVIVGDAPTKVKVERTVVVKQSADATSVSTAGSQGKESKAVETPTEVTTVSWKQDTTHPLGVRFTVPSKWTRTPSNKTARNPSVEYVCGRLEATYKSFKLLTVDLSAATVPVPQAIREFTEHYRMQVDRPTQGQVRLYLFLVVCGSVPPIPIVYAIVDSASQGCWKNGAQHPRWQTQPHQPKRILRICSKYRWMWRAWSERQRLLSVLQSYPQLAPCLVSWQHSPPAQRCDSHSALVVATGVYVK